MLGGYFNVVIPVDKNSGEISDKYSRFIEDYDPDLVILAPGISLQEIRLNLRSVHPFAIISWDSASQVATKNPMRFESGINSTLRGLNIDSSKKPVIAVADSNYPDTSRLAFVACGDVESNHLDPDNPLDRITRKFDSSGRGYREQILGKFLKPECNPKALYYHIKSGILIPSPDRYELKNLIREYDQFPLYGAVEILDTCCKMQGLFNSQWWSFIGSTASYAKSTALHKVPYNMVILVSDKFSLEEAILFWNLRAQEVYVTWLSFSELERDKISIERWLGDIFGGALCVDQPRFIPADVNLAFSSQDRDIDRLKIIFDYLENAKRKYSTWRIVSYNDLVFYTYVRPPISQDRIMIAQDASICAFLPKLLPEMPSGMLTILLEWDGLMLPQYDALIPLISSDKIKGHKENDEHRIEMPRFRITKDRFLKIQNNNESEIEFNKPSTLQIFENIFSSAGFSKKGPSISAKYYIDFIKRAGSLEDAIRYFSTSPYKELLKLLSDNKDENKNGWILKNLERRVLNHLQLRNEVGEKTPEKVHDYFNTVCDELPKEATELLEKGLLERGFNLKCNSCSFESWYPIEQVGQEFKCLRCYHSQVYASNPLWLYKLAEVTYQGFKCDMEVPLLALAHLKRTSKRYFEWIPEVDVYWYEGGKEINRNIDIVCINDGKLFLGEAKSVDKIEKNLFKFYRDLSERMLPDGIVFATSRAKWNTSTIDCMEDLKKNFDGKVIILTHDDLYPS